MIRIENRPVLSPPEAAGKIFNISLSAAQDYNDKPPSENQAFLKAFLEGDSRWLTYHPPLILSAFELEALKGTIPRPRLLKNSETPHAGMMVALVEGQRYEVPAVLQPKKKAEFKFRGEYKRLVQTGDRDIYKTEELANGFCGSYKQLFDAGFEEQATFLGDQIRAGIDEIADEISQQPDDSPAETYKNVSYVYHSRLRRNWVLELVLKKIKDGRLVEKKLVDPLDLDFRNRGNGLSTLLGYILAAASNLEFNSRAVKAEFANKEKVKEWDYRMEPVKLSDGDTWNAVNPDAFAHISSETYVRINDPSQDIVADQVVEFLKARKICNDKKLRKL